MKKLFLISDIDKEDFWVSNGMSFPIDDDIKTYPDAIDANIELIRSSEVVNYIVEDSCLVEDEFEGDENWEFLNAEWKNSSLEFSFKTSDGTIHFIPRQCDFIHLVSNKN